MDCFVYNDSEVIKSIVVIGLSWLFRGIALFTMTVGQSVGLLCSGGFVCLK